MTELFIQKAKEEKHGDKNDYSLVNYLDCYTKIEVVCKTHAIKITTLSPYKYDEYVPVYHVHIYGCLLDQTNTPFKINT